MKRLIVQSNHSSKPEGWYKWLCDTRPITMEYVAHCKAEYHLFIGQKDPAVAPTWNRIPLILEAFDHGFDQVCWLDNDTMVLPDASCIFDAVDETPLHWVRIPNPETEDWYAVNDGVIVANNTPEAKACLRYVWGKRHHPMQHLEQFWLDRYADKHPEIVAALDPRFNWFFWPNGNVWWVPPRSEAFIVAWHAWDGNRFDVMYAEHGRVWPHRRDVW